MSVSFKILAITIMNLIVSLVFVTILTKVSCLYDTLKLKPSQHNVELEFKTITNKFMQYDRTIITICAQHYCPSIKLDQTQIAYKLEEIHHFVSKKGLKRNYIIFLEDVSSVLEIMTKLMRSKHWSKSQNRAIRIAVYYNTGKFEKVYFEKLWKNDFNHIIFITKSADDDLKQYV